MQQRPSLLQRGRYLDIRYRRFVTEPTRPPAHLKLRVAPTGGRMERPPQPGRRPTGARPAPPHGRVRFEPRTQPRFFTQRGLSNGGFDSPRAISSGRPAGRVTLRCFPRCSLLGPRCAPGCYTACRLLHRLAPICTERAGQTSASIGFRDRRKWRRGQELRPEGKSPQAVRACGD